MTARQVMAFDKTVENGGVVSSAMLEVGYSPAMAKNPQKLTESIGWRKLMDEHLKDDVLLRKHSEGLDATKLVTSPTEPDREVVDFAVRHKYLETAYKLKGRLKEESVFGSGNEIKILVIPSEAMEKYEISSDSVGSGQVEDKV